ncbi:copper resistance CopC/CopD family protein [Streptosporangium saharense]|uniref:copper resistance CopC/CopD family protein n=1 Tax=Streptosporangium saharense TaxID=1706840 RepID=UPI00341FE173
MMRHLPALAVLVVVVLGVGVSPAYAHAFLLRSDPPYDAALPVSPAVITLEFSEPVRVEAAAVAVLDGAGQRVDLADARNGRTGSSVVVGLRPRLPRGTYIVSWHVVSADTHPVGGSLQFGVGRAPDAPAPATDAGATPLLDYVTGLAHTAQTVGLAALVGGGFFLVVLWPAALRRRAPRGLLWTGWWLVFSASVVLLLTQGARASGDGFAALLRWDSLASTMGYAYGGLTVLRLVLLLAGTVALRHLPRRWAAVAGGLAALGIVATEAALGHAGYGDDSPLAVLSLTAHISAMALWVGGLAVLVLLALAPPAEPYGILRRWSAVAGALVGVLVVSGVYQAWREVGSLPALTGTRYGVLLLVKLALFAGALSAAAVVRRRVHAASRPLVRRVVAVELILNLAVLAVTSTLVASPPAVSTYGPPFETTVQAGPVRARLAVTPTLPGPQSVVVSFSGDQRVTEVSGQLSLPEERLGPIDVTFRPDGAGRFASSGLSVPRPGLWHLRLAVRLTESATYVLTVPYRTH